MSEILILREALRKYANPDNWCDNETHSGDVEKSIVWCGDDPDEKGFEVAQKTLEKLRLSLKSTIKPN